MRKRGTSDECRTRGTGDAGARPAVEAMFDVDSCVCFELSFEEILRRCRRDAIDDLDGIRRAFGCGSGCGLCTPYLANMLRSGRTRFRLDEGIV
ncbi:MAG: (2Fe-2S)-binding protein [Phycisphaerales bacterium]|nr:(2Fe-2S)-binding protein [Phycisphaerales bacterium]